MTIPRRILLLFAHPALRKPRINRRLPAAAQTVAGVTVRGFYQKYPEFRIDSGHGQALLDAHDVILTQHPFYRYSCPVAVFGAEGATQFTIRQLLAPFMQTSRPCRIHWLPPFLVQADRGDPSNQPDNSWDTQSLAKEARGEKA